MGNKCKVSSGRSRKALQIERELRDVQINEQRTVSLLMIGTGDSGKTTLTKQMKILYKGGFNSEQRQEYRSAIRFNLKDHIETLIEVKMDIYSTEPLSEPAARFLEVSRRVPTITDEEKELMITIWNNPKYKYLFEIRHRFQLPDTAAYFLDRIEEICEPDWMPSDMDILNCRIPTTGVNEVLFESRGLMWRLIDLGGQRSERRKWISFFEEIESVIFVCAVSEYNQKLYEDERLNRLQESIATFESVIGLKKFHEKRITLILNKIDIFEEKLKRFKFSDYFPEYSGDNNPDDVIAYITEMFFQKLRREKGHELGVYRLCATVSEQVEKAFQELQDEILRNR